MENQNAFKVSFVILHYMDTDTTVNCINSILKNIKYDDYSIIVVDNGSSNHSGAMLQEKYEFEKKVEVIISEENLGFAKGNNIGYSFAKERYHADFIIVSNNDVLFQDEDFVDRIIKIYNESGCYLLGPDIVTPDEKHQNPFRPHPLTYSEAKKKARNRKIFLQYLKIKRALHIGNKIHILEDAFEKQNNQIQNYKNWREAQFDVVLHGSCIIYTPLFIEEEDCAFLPDTFMYGEEDLLADMCKQKKFKTFYSPEIHVTHLEGKSTSAIKKSSDRILFQNENILKGEKILLNKLKDHK